jgi:hypothetical protein
MTDINLLNNNDLKLLTNQFNNHSESSSNDYENSSEENLELVKFENNRQIIDNVIIIKNELNNNNNLFIDCEDNLKGNNLLKYDAPEPNKLPVTGLKKMNKNKTKYRIYMCVCGTEELTYMNAELSISSFRDNGFKGPIDIITDDPQFKPAGVTNIIYIEKSDMAIYSGFKLKAFDYLPYKKDEVLIYIDNGIINLNKLNDIYLNEKIAVYAIFGKSETFKSHKILNAVSFSTSILIFRPTDKIKKLFTTIWNEYILSRKNKNQFEKPYAHPYIIKYLLINDMVDYSLTPIVLTDINHDKIESRHIFGNFTKESLQEKKKLLEYLKNKEN